jgi:hypothetical protein
MFLNIITPSSRPQNLHAIAASINIPQEKYKWIVVFDANEYPETALIPKNCETYLFRDQNSTVGHAQRNFALDLIDSGHVYMNDDDTTVHPELWNHIKDIDADFICFAQSNADGTLRLPGNRIEINHIDSHNFIVSRNAIGDIRWHIERYDADGYFATEIFNKLPGRFDSINPAAIYIPHVLSIYNSLR